MRLKKMHRNKKRKLFRQIQAGKKRPQKPITIHITCDTSKATESIEKFKVAMDKLAEKVRKFGKTLIPEKSISSAELRRISHREFEEKYLGFDTRESKVCGHKLAQTVNALREAPMWRHCELTLKESYEVLADFCESHDLLCQCFHCNLFLQVGDEMVRRKMVKNDKHKPGN